MRDDQKPRRPWWLKWRGRGTVRTSDGLADPALRVIARAWPLVKVQLVHAEQIEDMAEAVLLAVRDAAGEGLH
jgi:hypothetical protein